MVVFYAFFFFFLSYKALKKFTCLGVSKFLRIMQFALPTLTFHYFSSGWKSVLLIPAPCQTWLHLEWQSRQYSKRIFCPLLPSHILQQNHPHRLQGGEHSVPIQVLYQHTFSISNQRVALCSREWWQSQWDDPTNIAGKWHNKWNYWLCYPGFQKPSRNRVQKYGTCFSQGVVPLLWHELYL